MFSQPFSVRLSELDQNGKLQPYHLISYFQDTASVYLQGLEMSGFDLAKNNQGWVINAMTVLFDGDLPGWNEKVDLTTWALNKTGIRLFRDFTAHDKNNQLLAQGTTSWVIIDKGSRQPVALDHFQNKELIIGEPTLPEVKPGRFEELPTQQDRENFVYLWNPRSSEQDLNRHINNINYLIACIESIPFELRQDKKLSRVDIIFKAEIHIHQPIEIQTQWTGETAIHHLIRKSDQVEVSKARTLWR